MKKINYKYIYQRTREMLMKPEHSWSSVLKEDFAPSDIFRNYLVPIALVISICVLLLSLLNYTTLQAVGLALIYLISALSGTWLAYLITKEYLCGKLNYRDNEALNLSVYSAAIFIIFHGIGNAMGNAFVGQLFTLLSFIFIRTLYTGIGQLPKMQAAQKTNVLVIASLSIICLPIIISQILMIVFRISAINI